MDQALAIGAGKPAPLQAAAGAGEESSDAAC